MSPSGWIRVPRRLAIATSLLVLGSSAGLAVHGAPSLASTSQCGLWRWPVKTLSDLLAPKVDLHPVDRKVPYLRTLDPPDDVFTWGPFKARTKGVERRTYRVHVRLLKAVREDDRDIHLVVAGRFAKSKTMIMELPDPTCSGALKSKQRPAMRRARSRLLADCGSIGTSFVDLKGTATITGVGFWDDVHGQTGVAPNGIELHPVLSYSGSCSKATSSSSGAGGSGGGDCSPAYPDFCIPPPPPDLDCADVNGTNFTVLAPDPHGFDGDGDGVGCET